MIHSILWSFFNSAPGSNCTWVRLGVAACPISQSALTWVRNKDKLRSPCPRRLASSFCRRARTPVNDRVTALSLHKRDTSDWSPCTDVRAAASRCNVLQFSPIMFRPKMQSEDTFNVSGQVWAVQMTFLSDPPKIARKPGPDVRRIRRLDVARPQSSSAWASTANRPSMSLVGGSTSSIWLSSLSRVSAALPRAGRDARWNDLWYLTR